MEQIANLSTGNRCQGSNPCLSAIVIPITSEVNVLGIFTFIIVDEGEICHNILLLSQNEKIIAEPAGAMSIAALRKYKNKIKNKNIMCLICGGNNDPKRLPEIEKRSQEWLYKMKK